MDMKLIIKPAIRISLVYVMIGIIWVAFSDSLLLYLLASDIKQLTVMQTYKGWVYVSGTGLLLYFLLRRELRIREQKEVLLENEKKFASAVVNTAGALVLVTDSEGRIIKFNRACEKITGYSDHEVIGVHIWNLLLVSEEVAVFQRVFEVLKTSKESVEHEACLVNRNGDRRVIAWSNTILFDNQGLVEYIICTGIDITERKQIEYELRKHRAQLEELVTERTTDLIQANEKLKQEMTERKRAEEARKQMEKEMVRLEQLNLIGEMAAGIAHEIRNPMTTVRGFLQVFQSKDSFMEFRDYLELMIKELDSANSIITEFLYLAKNKAVDVEKLNLNTIIETLLPLMQADAANSEKYTNLELTDIPDLYLNEKEMRQLILNLVRNGLEAMSPGGNLTIKTYLEGQEVVLGVQDQGTGIEPGSLEKLGTPFFTTKDQGTGLGLAVCYSIAARYNAVIKVDTSPSGTTFFVRFRRPQQAFL
ncbi:Sporulation kinase E [Sporotomaculum syntrophicum]|uniref:histidine kinase n=2 Tax=Sporotomaculum syntrophicum TaxID=182264 RepID=A0A9D3AVY2_9FIRM|nr:Sporulation kinase E [Sporotomaculum syntrophicum]